MTSEWIQVGELARTLGAYALPPSAALDGRSIDLHFEDGSQIRHEFLPGSRLVWQVLRDRGIAGGYLGPVTESCRVSEARPGIYFVDFQKSERYTQTVSLILDLNRQVGTTVIGELPTAAEIDVPIYRRAVKNVELPAVKARLVPVRLDAPITGAVDWHQPSETLVGRLIAFRYSDVDVYEHIYLSSHRFTWHCLSGAEAGLADTDYAEYREIADDLVLFCWREKIVPTLGLLLIDLQRGGSAGKVLGYTDASLTLVTNSPVGAQIMKA